MSDIATIWDATLGRGDYGLPPSTFSYLVDEATNPVVDEDGRNITDGFTGTTPGQGLIAGQDLQTAVLISIFTDAEAGPDDKIPDGSGDPRGWWGDPTIGSKVWLRLRLPANDQTLLLVKADIEAATAWLVSDQIAAAVDVVTEWTRPGLLGARVAVRRTDGTTVAVAFDWAWKEL